MELNYKEIEQKIGYTFKNKKLIDEAFTAHSYGSKNNTFDNEVLEFIGDRMLDFCVTKILVKRFKLPNKEGFFNTSLDEGELSIIKENIVEKEALSFFMEELDLEKYLLTFPSKVTRLVTRIDNRENLFEAILGAIAEDSNYNANALLKSVKQMINFNHIFSVLKERNYIYEIRVSKYKNEKYDTRRIGPNDYVTELKIKDQIFKGTGKSRFEAKMLASKEAFKVVLGVTQIKEEIELQKKKTKEAKNIIDVLINKNLIKTPNEIHHTYNESDKTWTLRITFPNPNKVVSVKDKNITSGTKEIYKRYLNYLINLKETK